MDSKPSASGSPPLLQFALSQIILTVAAALGAFLVSANPFRESLSYGAVLTLCALAIAVLSASFCAFLLMTRLRVFWFGGTLIGFVAVGIWRFNLLMIPLFFAFTLPALLLALMMRKKKPRLVCVGSLAALFTLLLCAIGVLAVYDHLGYFTPEGTLQLVYRAGDTVKALLLGLSAYNAETGVVTAWISEELAGELVKSAIISLPGFALTFCLALAFIQSFFVRLGLKLCGVLSFLYPDGFYPLPSLATAFVFCVCLFISSLLGELLGIVAYATFYNLSNVLAFLFAVVGFDAAIRRIARRRRRTPSAVFLLLIAVVLFGAIFSAGLTGAAQILISLSAFFISILYPILYFFGLFTVFWSSYKNRKASAK